MDTKKKTHQEVIAATSLKKLDPALLTIALMQEADAKGFNTSQTFDAIAFASVLHSGQRRLNRGNLPRTSYIEHPLRNAIRLMRWGCTSDEIIIAEILHDTMEDCSLRFVAEYNVEGIDKKDEPKAREALSRHIEREYGVEVARVVGKVTNPFYTREYWNSFNKEEKREKYFIDVVEAIRDDVATLLVKFSDFVDNAGSLHHQDLDPHKEKIENLAMKYTPMVPVFRQAFHQQSEKLAALGIRSSELFEQLASIEQRLRTITDRM